MMEMGSQKVYLVLLKLLNDTHLYKKCYLWNELSISSEY